MKKLLLKILQARAKAVMTEFKPTVVAVTGSVGKTSTREAIALALAGSFAVRTPQKNYNNEFGLPLAILGEASPGKNPVKWLGLLVRSFNIKKYPNMLVLEYGADKRGDIGTLCDIAEPDVAVITAISPVHVANYRSLDELVLEKQTLAMRTSNEGLVVLNADDATVAAMQTSIVTPITTYGIDDAADVVAGDIIVTTKPTISTRALVRVGAEEAELVLDNCLGRTSVSACLAALAVAKYFKIELNDAVARLNKGVKPMPGRLNPLAGIKQTLIIDDTYNAAPASVAAALEVLHGFVPRHDLSSKGNRRIAVLGKMAELGNLSMSEHEAVGKQVAEVANIFIAVGEEMKAAVAAAKMAGMKCGDVVWFATPTEAGRWLDANIETGDIVLVKGSQSARMEKAVRDVLAEPLRSSELLVRQERYWLRR